MAAAAVRVRAPASEGEARVARAVLVVEDEAFVREVTCSVLARETYSVLWARDADEARRIFARHASQIAAVICDAVLPDGNAVALAREFRRQTPRLNIVVASGYPPAMLARELHQEPGVTLLSKPYSSETLIRQLREALKPKYERSEPDADILQSAKPLDGDAIPLVS